MVFHGCKFYLSRGSNRQKLENLKLPEVPGSLSKTSDLLQRQLRIRPTPPKSNKSGDEKNPNYISLSNCDMPQISIKDATVLLCTIAGLSETACITYGSSSNNVRRHSQCLHTQNVASTNRQAKQTSNKHVFVSSLCSPYVSTPVQYLPLYRLCRD